MSIHFRKCILSDLNELVAISKTTFVEAFEKDNDPTDFKVYIDVAFATATIKKQLENIDSTFYFVFKDAILVGYFKLNVNKAQTDIKADDSIELERIYVLKEYQGKQIGKRMLQYAINSAKEQKKANIWLGVWENNVDAIRFYEKYGFEKFDTHPYYIGDDKQTDWLMRFDLNQQA